jgi:hypothetical protein
VLHGECCRVEGAENVSINGTDCNDVIYELIDNNKDTKSDIEMCSERCTQVYFMLFNFMTNE